MRASLEFRMALARFGCSNLGLFGRPCLIIRHYRMTDDALLSTAAFSSPYALRQLFLLCFMRQEFMDCRRIQMRGALRMNEGDGNESTREREERKA